MSRLEGEGALGGVQVSCSHAHNFFTSSSGSDDMLQEENFLACGCFSTYLVYNSKNVFSRALGAAQPYVRGVGVGGGVPL
jgi:hypothetical protein